MISTAAGKPLALSETQRSPHTTRSLAGRKLWLPKLLYDALPYFYLASGIAAFFATLYISDWFWVLPHYFLFSIACFHMGILVYRRRLSQRSNGSNSEQS